MNDSDTEEDPFLAVSDDSEKAIQDIDAFLNAPSSVVVKAQDPFRISSAKSSPRTMNGANKQTKPDTDGHQSDLFKLDSSVFELPDSIESIDSNKTNNLDDTKKNDQFGQREVPKQPLETAQTKTFESPNPVKNENNATTSSTTLTNSNNNKGRRRPPIQRHNLLSNLDLTNALMLSDNANNNNATPVDDMNNKNNKTNNMNNKINKPINNNNNKTTNNNNRANNSNNKTNNNNTSNVNKALIAESKKTVEKPSPVDTTIVNMTMNDELLSFVSDSDSVQSAMPSPPQPKSTFSSQNPNLTNNDNKKITQNDNNYKRNNYSYNYDTDTPRSHVDIFETSFVCYLNAAVDDLRITFIEELQSLIIYCFDFDRYITDFLANLEKDLRVILDEGISSIEMPPVEYDIDYIDTHFNQITSLIPKRPQKSDLDQTQIEILSPHELLKNAKSTFEANCGPIASELTVLSNIASPMSENRSYFAYEQKMEMIYDLEAREYELDLEKQSTNSKLGKLKVEQNQFREKSVSLINSKDSDSNENDFKEDLDEITEMLEQVNIQKEISPHKSFSNKSKLLIDELTIINTQLFTKIDRFARSLSLCKAHDMETLAAMQHQQMQIPLQSPPKKLAQSNASFERELSSPSRSNFVNNVKERLTQIKRMREDQIAETQKSSLELQ